MINEIIISGQIEATLSNNKIISKDKMIVKIIDGNILKIKSLNNIINGINNYIKFDKNEKGVLSFDIDQDLNLEKIDISGQINLIFKQDVELKNIKKIDISGQSKTKINGTILKHDLKVDCSGQSEIELGYIESEHDFKINCSGQSKVDVKNVKNKNTKIDCSGQSETNLYNFNSGILKLNCSGMSNIRGEVNCKDIKKEKSGFSKISITEKNNKSFKYNNRFNNQNEDINNKVQTNDSINIIKETEDKINKVQKVIIEDDEIDELL